MSAAELRAALEALGLTQREAAFRAGVNPRTLRRWLAGGSRIPAAVAELVRVWVARRHGEMSPAAGRHSPLAGSQQ